MLKKNVTCKLQTQVTKKDRSSQMFSRGFTLIELLVVIAIIALLLSILMPALSRVKEQARQVICATNLRTMGMGYHLYSADYEGWFPARYRLVAGQRIDAWQYEISPYIDVDQDEIYEWGSPKNEAGEWTNTLKVFYCPSGVKDTQRKENNRYYSYNTWGIGVQAKAATVRSGVILLVDHYHIDLWNPAYYDYNYDPALPSTGAAAQPAMKPVHGKGYNYLFPDGHVNWMENSVESQWKNK